jgi:hypothetical protein
MSAKRRKHKHHHKKHPKHHDKKHHKEHDNKDKLVGRQIAINMILGDNTMIADLHLPENFPQMSME